MPLVPKDNKTGYTCVNSLVVYPQFTLALKEQSCQPGMGWWGGFGVGEDRGRQQVGGALALGGMLRLRGGWVSGGCLDIKVGMPLNHGTRRAWHGTACLGCIEWLNSSSGVKAARAIAQRGSEAVFELDIALPSIVVQPSPFLVTG